MFSHELTALVEEELRKRPQLSDYQRSVVSRTGPSFFDVDVRLFEEGREVSIYQFSATDIRCTLVSWNGNLLVIDHYRGKGIGRALVESREAVCKKMDVEEIVVWCISNQVKCFWEHLGYRDRDGDREVYVKQLCKDRR